jgi:hypothetical protein
MKKILLSLAAFMIAATSFAFEDFKINLESISVNQTSKTKVAKPEVEQKSFFVKPGFKDGKIQSVSLGVSLDGRDSNALLVTNLDSYKILDRTVETVATVSTDRYGNKAAVGAGVLVPLGEHFGVSLNVGGYFEGLDLAAKGRISNRLVPAVTARIDLNKTLSVFGLRL